MRRVPRTARPVAGQPPVRGPHLPVTDLVSRLKRSMFDAEIDEASMTWDAPHVVAVYDPSIDRHWFVGPFNGPTAASAFAVGLSDSVSRADPDRAPLVTIVGALESPGTTVDSLPSRR